MSELFTGYSSREEVQNPPLRMNMRDGKEQEEQQRTDHFSFLLMASG